MLVPPALTAVNIPVEALMVAADVLLLLHAPPDGEHVNEESMVPGQINVLPVIGSAARFTVTSLVTKQEEDAVV